MTALPPLQPFGDFRAVVAPLLEEVIASTLRRELRAAPLCREMASYQLSTGGKRLRGLLPSYLFQALGRDPTEALPLGVAVELLHNATLIHDDLQDGDTLRRGRPTVWVKYSAPHAIDAGTALVLGALRGIHRAGPKGSALAARASECMLGIYEGQSQEFQMKAEERPRLLRYLRVARAKTALLFAFTIEAALEFAGQSPQVIRAGALAGARLGLLFQLQDDLLDLYGAKGRDRVATDIAEGKVSALVAYCYEVANTSDCAELRAILGKPRETTTDADIDRALSIFSRWDAAARVASAGRSLRDGALRIVSRQAPQLTPVFDGLINLVLGSVPQVPVGHCSQREGRSTSSDG